ncbi:MAG: AAA family ATPase [Pyrinomonadaceae bacterium]|nr:AAA family ATPase [Pyrinomonadaceae bacterium]
MGHSYLEDIPTDAPEFNYGLVAQALAPLLKQKSTGATVVGIHGSWGTGKTTLMRALERELKKTFDDKAHVFIQFNAWKYQERQALWRALILRVLGELRNRDVDVVKLSELEASLYRSFAVEEKGPWKLNWRTLIIELLGILLSVVKLDFVSKALKESGGFFGKLLSWGGGKSAKDNEAALVDKERIEKMASVLERTTVERQVVQVESIEQFLDKFSELINKSAAGDRRVFVFIDDLDRCLPESALEIFEAIKLFLDAPGCGYVVALDRDVIRKGLAVRYSQQSKDAGGGLFVDPDEYIEKTISVSYDLPRLSAADALDIIKEYELTVALDQQHHNLILLALGPNPRRIKRFMNTLSVQLQLARLVRESGAPIDESLISFAADGAVRQFDYFLKLALLAYKYSGLFSLALKDPGLLRRLQVLSNDYKNNVDKDPGAARVKRNLALDTEPTLLGGLKTEEEFWQLMASTPSVLDDFKLTTRLLSWFRQTGTAEKID